MKKLIMAMLVLALAGSAFADTKTESIRLRGAKSYYVPRSDGSGSWGGGDIMLGNYYYLGSSYMTDNIYELDISAFNFASIDSVEIINYGGFYDLENTTGLDENLEAITISFYKGGTGDAEADWTGSSLTLVKEISGLSTKEICDGFTINDLSFGDDDILTFVISIDKSLIPEMSTEGTGIGFRSGPGQFQLTLTGTSAVPEPSTYICGKFRRIGVGLCNLPPPQVIELFNL